MLQTFGCHLHSEGGAARFVPITRENLPEALKAARDMLDAEPSLKSIEIHPCTGGLFEVIQSAAAVTNIPSRPTRPA